MTATFTSDNAKAIKKAKIIHIRVLEFACRHLNCSTLRDGRPRTSKNDWAESIILWVKFLYRADHNIRSSLLCFLQRRLQPEQVLYWC